MTRSIQRHLILYVLPRGRNKAMRAIYLDFTARGVVKHMTTDIPTICDAPWLAIQRKEYDRLCDLHGLRTIPIRIPLTDEEKERRKRKAESKYRERIDQKRKLLGLPMTHVPLGQRAPDEDVKRAMHLLGEIDPETGRAYTGVKIAILVQRSASFVSRVKNGTRRQAYNGSE